MVALFVVATLYHLKMCWYIPLLLIDTILGHTYTPCEPIQIKFELQHALLVMITVVRAVMSNTCAQKRNDYL